jgi:hypothetical protein
MNTESMLSCCICTIVEGEKHYQASYRGCRHVKEELLRRRAQKVPKGSSERTFFSRFTSPEQSYTAALSQDTQHQQPLPPQTDGKACSTPCRCIWHNRKFRQRACWYRLLVRLVMAIHYLYLPSRILISWPYDNYMLLHMYTYTYLERHKFLCSFFNIFIFYYTIS